MQFVYMCVFEQLLTPPWASCQIQKIAVAHAPGMPGTFSPPSDASDPDMHHGTCVTHVPWCMPGSLTSGFLWSRRRVKAFPAHAQRYVSGKRPMLWYGKGDLCFSCRYYFVRNRQADTALRWRHNDHDSVWNHQPHDSLPNLLFGRRSK